MAGAAVKKARGDGLGHASTIREFLPWHVIEKKMSLRPDEPVVEAPPDSGVYTSGPYPAANECDGAAPDPAALSYKVYTLAELESAGIQADMSVSATRRSFVMAQRQTPWADAARAALVVAVMAKTWALAPSPRPAAKDVFRAPLVALMFELCAALRQVEWKRVGIGVGLAFGTFLFLLFAVVTAAELTDDLKPARASHVASGDSYTSAIVAAAQPTPAPRPVATTQTVDLDLSFDVSPVPPPTPHAVRTSVGKGTKRAVKAEVFIP